MVPIIDEASVAKLMKGFSIPPRPAALVELKRLQDSPTLNQGKIAQVVSSDPGLAAGVIKTVNSPLFGLRHKVTAIPQAVLLLGARNLAAVVASIALRAALGGKELRMERFWDSAMHVASISADIAKTLPGIASDDAYALGMFHDCGIAIMMQKFHDYKEFLMHANQAGYPLVELEEERYQTDHARLGYLVARSWNLPEHLCLAILKHHDRNIFTEDAADLDRRVQPLVAVLKIAAHVSHGVRGLADAGDWEHLKQGVLHHLGLTEEELAEIEADVCEKAAGPAAARSRLAN